MKKLFAALIVACAIALPAAAYEPTDTTNGGSCTIAQPVAVLAQMSPAPAAPTQTTTTVESSGVPVKTTVSVGTLGSQVLDWVLVTFGSTIGLAATAVLMRWLKLLGIQASDAMRDKLQQMVVNGMNLAGAWAEENMKDRGKVEIKNEIEKRTIAYMQAHGADTFKKLGGDVMTDRAVEVIKARFETALVDPTVPTPPLITPPPVLPVIQAARPA